MDLVLRIVILIIGLPLGVALVKYSYQITQVFGHNSLAERYIGEGGTYTMWKLLGLVVIFTAAWFGLR
jgi:hypothetical protein